MKYVYKVWCEWDIGLNEVVFMSCEGAWAAASEALDNVGEDIEEAKTNGLVDVELWSICE